MTLARLVNFLLPEKKVWGLKATMLTKIFVGLDIVSFIVQAIGGSMLSGGGPDVDVRIVQIGQQIYTTGVAVQGAFIVVFTGICFTFHSRVRALTREGTIEKRKGVNRIAWTLYVVLALIFVSYTFLSRPRQRLTRPDPHYLSYCGIHQGSQRRKSAHHSRRISPGSRRSAHVPSLAVDEHLPPQHAATWARQRLYVSQGEETAEARKERSQKRKEGGQEGCQSLGEEREPSHRH